jgi:hypothetical protein
MALPHMTLLMRQVQKFAFMTPVDYKVLSAICTGKTIGANTIEQARSAMAAAADCHVRTTQKSTTRLAEHGMLTITRERISPTRNKINVYHINEDFFRTFLRAYTADFQRHILHKRAHAQAGHPNFPGGENSLREVLSPPGSLEKSENKPAREKGGLPALMPPGYEQGKARHFLEWLGSKPTFEHHDAMLAVLMCGRDEERTDH